MVSIGSVNIGILRAAGYRVGANAIPERQRRMKLKRIYLTDLFAEDEFSYLDPDYLNQWGRPESPERFDKIAKTLSGLAGLAIRRGPQHREAAMHYESDFAWLVEEVKNRHFGFDRHRIV